MTASGDAPEQIQPTKPDRSEPRWSADRLRQRLRQPLSRQPYLWDVAVKARPGKRSTLVERDSDLLIEGFLRSGNTYSAAAFLLSNSPQVSLARHLHAGAHVLRAARLGVPTLVLAREPRAAVASYLVRRPSLTVADALGEYSDFYRTAWRVRQCFVVGLFDDVVSDFGAVVARVNARFGTAFVRYLPTADAESATMALVEEMNRRECGGQLVETHVGRPSESRELRKDTIRWALARPDVATRLGTALEWYDRFTELSRDDL